MTFQIVKRLVTLYSRVLLPRGQLDLPSTASLIFCFVLFSIAWLPRLLNFFLQHPSLNKMLNYLQYIQDITFLEVAYKHNISILANLANLHVKVRNSSSFSHPSAGEQDGFVNGSTHLPDGVLITRLDSMWYGASCALGRGGLKHQG